MLIAVATDDGKSIAGHFGRCGFFSIWQCRDGGETVHIGLRPNTFTAHLKPMGTVIPEGMRSAPGPGEIPGEPAKLASSEEDAATGLGSQNRDMLHQLQSGHGQHTQVGILTGLADISVVITAGMGRRAVTALEGKQKEVFVTQEADVESAVNKYIAGHLDSSGPCKDGL